MAAQSEPLQTLVPTRAIKASCRTSVTLAALSHGSERLCWRLITVADDFGRFEASPDVVMAFCFPRMLKKVRRSDVEGWLKEMVSVDLIRIYTVNGNDFGYFVTWDKHQRRRARFAKFPAPDSTCQQMTSDVVNGGHPLSDVARVSSIEYRVSSIEKEAGARVVLTDDQFLQSLRVNPAYEGIDLTAELAKIDAWLLANPRRKKTRRFVVNWLNRIERPLPGGQKLAGPGYITL